MNNIHQVTGERMGLEDFLYPEEGLELARRCGSSAWMYPYITPDCEFQSYSYLRDEKIASPLPSSPRAAPSPITWSPKTIQEILDESHLPHLYQIYDDHYLVCSLFVLLIIFTT